MFSFGPAPVPAAEASTVGKAMRGLRAHVQAPRTIERTGVLLGFLFSFSVGVGLRETRNTAIYL